MKIKKRKDLPTEKSNTKKLVKAAGRLLSRELKKPVSRTDRSIEAGLRNITPHQFKPGVSGNPAGRPKGSRTGIRYRLEKLLRRRPPEEAVGLLLQQGCNVRPEDIAEALAYRLIHAGLTGDVSAIRTMLEQTEEPIKQRLSHEGPEGGPVNFILPPMPREASE